MRYLLISPIDNCVAVKQMVSHDGQIAACVAVNLIRVAQRAYLRAAPLEEDNGFAHNDRFHPPVSAKIRLLLDQAAAVSQISFVRRLVIDF